MSSFRISTKRTWIIPALAMGVLGAGMIVMASMLPQVRELLIWCKGFALEHWSAHQWFFILIASAAAFGLAGIFNVLVFFVRYFRKHRHLIQVANCAATSPHAFAFTYGLLQPRIVLSYGLRRALTKAQLRAVFLHEQAHVHRRDPLRRFIGGAISAFFVYLPVFKDIAVSCREHHEIIADAQALKRGARAQDIAESIGKVKMAFDGQDMAVGFACSYSPTVARLEMLASSSPRRFSFTFSRQRILISCAAIMLFAIPVVGLAIEGGKGEQGVYSLAMTAGRCAGVHPEMSPVHPQSVQYTPAHTSFSSP